MNTDEIRLKMKLATDKIRDASLRAWTLDVLEALPEKAWQREASLKYHHPDEQGSGGNKLHERRVARLADIICDLYNLTPLDRDMVYTASLLHDACRHGLEAEEKYTVKDHANLVRTFIEQNCEESIWTNLVCTLIDTHMSRWGVPPYLPTIKLQDIVVLADYIASQPDVEVRI